MSDFAQEELLEVVGGLKASDQRRVIDFARALAASRPAGVPGATLERFAGVISPGDLQRIMDAIQEDCEQVDRDAW